MPNPISRALFNLFFGSKRKALSMLPGPEPGILGTAGEFLGAPPWDVCARYGREYGGATLIWIAGTPGLVLNDPELIEQVLESRRMEFEKGKIGEQIRPSVTGYSVFIANQSEDWAEKRRAEPFEQTWAESWLVDQVGPMQAETAAQVDRLLDGPSTDLVPVLRRLVFDVFAIAAVGEKVPDSVFDDFMVLAKAATDRILAVRPLSLVPKPRGFKAAHARFYEHFAERVRAARRAPNPRAVDLLSRALREKPDFDDRTLAHVVALTFFGGVFSSSTTLAGAFHQLHKHPAADARLATEAAALAERPLAFEQLRSARWVEAVVYEAMRILPPVRIMTRTPVADVKLAGIALPAGSMIMISNQHLHRDPAHWANPDTFDPARWLDGGIDRDPLGSGHFFPFGRGPRECVGTAFGMVCMETILATIAARAKVEVDSTKPFEEGFFFGVVLPTGLTGRFVRRRA